MSNEALAILITVATFGLFITEWLPVSITSLLAAAAMGIFGIIPFETAFSGFSNDITLFVLGMTAISGALYETGVASQMGELVVTKVGGDEKKIFLAALTAACVLSAFISNTATVALIMSTLGPICIASKGKLQQKNIYMGVSFASVVGGASTLIGSTPQLVAQGIIQQRGYAPMSFFDLTIPGIPMIIALLLYYYLFAYKRQKKAFDFPDPSLSTLEKGDRLNFKGNAFQKWAPVVLMLIVIVFIIKGTATAGFVAIVGACLCVAVGSISVNQLVRCIDWPTIFVLVGTLGFAEGIEGSGLVSSVAAKLATVIGGETSPYIILAIFMLIGLVMTNLMSNTATIIILLPITLGLSNQLGFSHMPFVIGMVWACSLALMTPIGTAPVTMSMSAGYRVKDYMKLGGVYTVIGFMLLMIVVPLAFPF